MTSQGITQLPFTVHWELVSYLSWRDMLALRRVDTWHRNTVDTVGGDILIEHFVSRARSVILRRGVLQPGRFRHAYLSHAGIDGELLFVRVMTALRRVDRPPPNLAGILASVIQAGVSRSSAASDDTISVLLLPAATPVGQLLIRWWTLAVQDDQEARGRAFIRTESVELAPAAGVARLCSALQFGRIDGETTLQAACRVGKVEAQLQTTLSSATAVNVLLAQTAQQAPIVLPASNFASMSSSLRFNSTTSPTSQSGGDFGTYRAFREPSDTFAPAAPADAPGLSDEERAVVARRKVLEEHVVATGTFFFRVAASASAAPAAVASAGRKMLRKHIARLIPSSDAAASADIVLSGLTALTEDTAVGPPDPDFYNVVGFDKSTLPLRSLDLVAFALNAAPIRILGLRVTRGYTVEDSATAIRVVVEVTGDLQRPAVTLSQVTRLWFATSPPLAFTRMGISAKVSSVVVMDLTQVSLDVDSLPAGLFAGSVPALQALFLPLHVKTLHDGCIADCPALRVVVAAARAPFTPLYLRGSAPPSAAGPGVGVGYAEDWGTVDLSAAWRLDAVGPNVFRRCPLLRRIMSGPHLTQIGDGVALRCAGLRELDLSASTELTVIPSQLGSMSASLEVVRLPLSIVSFEFGAFRHCAMLSVVTPLPALTAKPIHFRENAFGGCGLANVTLPRGAVAVGRGAFEACLRLTRVDLGNSAVRQIGVRAFSACPLLASVVMPITVEQVGTRAFSGCTALTEIDLSKCRSLTVIGAEAFAGCAALTTVRFPAGNGPNQLTTLGASCFSETAVVEVDLAGLRCLTSIESDVFSRCPALVAVHLPKSESADDSAGVAAESAPKDKKHKQRPPAGGGTNPLLAVGPRDDTEAPSTLSIGAGFCSESSALREIHLPSAAKVVWSGEGIYPPELKLLGTTQAKPAWAPRHLLYSRKTPRHAAGDDGVDDARDAERAVSSGCGATCVVA